MFAQWLWWLVAAALSGAARKKEVGATAQMLATLELFRRKTKLNLHIKTQYFHKNLRLIVQELILVARQLLVHQNIPSAIQLPFPHYRTR